MNKYKYPRTYHFSFSPGASSDDKILEDDNIFDDKEIVITEKMDGENTSIYPDGSFHARSMDSKHHDYHSWLGGYIRQFNYKMNPNERICGEYLYAKHSIEYFALESYFYGFSLWKDNQCCSWEETIKRFSELELTVVPELYRGPANLTIIKNIANETINRGGEGIVVRLTDSFNIDDFSSSVGKFVRPNHIQTDKHWTIIYSTNRLINKLKR